MLTLSLMARCALVLLQSLFAGKGAVVLAAAARSQVRVLLVLPWS
jgi:hypothetical protein